MLDDVQNQMLNFIIFIQEFRHFVGNKTIDILLKFFYERLAH